MIKILFAGEGGQGIQAAAEILAKAAFLDGKKSLYIPNFGVEQRGGVSLAFVVIDEKEVVYPKFEKADILAIFADRSFKRIKRYISKETRIILGPATTQNLTKSIKVKENGLPAKVWNILVLGKINNLGKIVSKKSLIKAMEERFRKYFEKDSKIKEINLKALA
jgi:2-oxoglutarate ferredoxin oxidoreductase subunit gamma